MLTELVTRAEVLRGLHQPGNPVMLANAWDVASAQLVETAGFPAIATSSAAVALVHGFPDNDTMPLEVAFGAVHAIASRTDLPVTADLEAGYQLPAAEFVERLLAAGAVGCNLEDTDHHSDAALVDPEKQAARLSDVRAAATAAGVPIVINARVDVFARHRDAGPTPELRADAVRRGRLYLEAGADCVYPITLWDETAIAALIDEVGGNVNILLLPDGPRPPALARLGVARISMGSGLFRLTQRATKQILDDLIAEGVNVKPSS